MAIWVFPTPTEPNIKYLTEIEKSAMKPHLLEDLKLEGFDPKTDLKGKAIIFLAKQ